MLDAKRSTGASLTFSKSTTFFGEQRTGIQQLRLSLPGSHRSKLPSVWSRTQLKPVHSRVCQWISTQLHYSESLFQLGIFHKSLIFLFLGKADVLIHILRFPVEFNVLAENAHNTEHKCQVTTTMAGVALQ